MILIGQDFGQGRKGGWICSPLMIFLVMPCLRFVVDNVVGKVFDAGSSSGGWFKYLCQGLTFSLRAGAGNWVL